MIFCITLVFINYTIVFFLILFYIDPFLLTALIPIKSYSNAEADKAKILKENLGLSGIYLLTNLINGKQYVGSSKNLSRRFIKYFIINYFKYHFSMPICRDLLKYEYSNFSLTIIEYCEPSELKKREKHFIKLLNSAYNFIKNSTASPMSGRKHTEQSQHPKVAALIPIKSYSNAKADKKKILKENQNKSGIYMFTNKINGKKYVGSAVDLCKRLSFYFSIKALKNELKNSKSYIYNALLKDGYENFSLEILEYCSIEELLKREKHFIDYLHPKYNIIKDPTLPPMFGRKHSNKTKKIMSETENSGRFKPGQKRPEGAGSPSQTIEVTDITNNQTTTYDSISAAAKALNILQAVITMYFNRNKIKPYKGKYIFKQIPKYNIIQDPTLPPMSGRKHSDGTKIIMSDAKKGENNPMFGQNHTEESKTIMSEVKKGENNPMYNKPRAEGAGVPSQIIEVTDITNNQTTTYDSIHEAARALNINHTNISKYFSRNQQKPYKGIYTLKKIIVIKKTENSGSFLKSKKQIIEIQKTDNSGSFLKGKKKIKGAFEITYKKIEVFDKNTNQTTSYDSISEAARALNITKQVISYHLKALNPKPYKGRYTFSVLISNKTTTKHSAPSIKE